MSTRRRKNIENDPVFWQAREDRLRRFAAKMDAWNPNNVPKPDNASLEQWQAAHHPKDQITDDDLRRWTAVIKEGRTNNNWNNVLAMLNRTGAFPGDRIDKSDTEQYIQKLALLAISRITPPKMRLIAEENLRKGVGHA